MKDLKNLTSLVTQVQNHLLSQPTANSIQTETNGKKEKEELHNETSTNFDHEHHSSQDRISNYVSTKCRFQLFGFFQFHRCYERE